MKFTCKKNAFAAFSLACIIGGSPQASTAQALPNDMLARCESAIQGDAYSRFTAEFCLKAAAEIGSAIPYSKEHVQVLQKLALLSRYSKYLPETTEQYYNMALASAKSGFGDQSPLTLESRSNLAVLALEKKNWQKAREMYLQNISIIRKQVPNTYRERETFALDEIVRTYNFEEELSPHTYHVQDHIKAMKEHLAVLRDTKLETNYEKSSVGTSLLKLGRLQMGAGLLDEAKKSTQEAHAVFTETQSGKWAKQAVAQLQEIASKK